MKQYIVDAFTDQVFGGNPAAVCVLEDWLTEELMIKIARENNLSETAFIKKEGKDYQLRWFTPKEEIALCGHATLASAFVIMNKIDTNCDKVIFHTLSGMLTVIKNHDLYEMDFPIYELKPIQITDTIIDAIGCVPIEAYLGRDLLCVFDDEQTVRNLTPNMEKLKNIDGLLLQVTALGKDVDCVSRSFAPKLDVLEDPVCGSGHCHIVPYWANKLNKNEINAYQASKRGGMLYCKMCGNRIKISGHAVLYAEAEIFI